MIQSTQQAGAELVQLIQREANRDGLTWLQAFERLQHERPDVLEAYQAARRDPILRRQEAKQEAAERRAELLARYAEIQLDKKPAEKRPAFLGATLEYIYPGRGLDKDPAFLADALALIDESGGSIDFGELLAQLRAKYPKLLAFIDPTPQEAQNEQNQPTRP